MTVKDLTWGPSSTQGRTMRAIGLHEFGGPDVLHPVEVPRPHAGPGEVRIHVRAAAVNPADLHLRRGFVRAATMRPPYIPGQDAAGVIDEIGPGTRTTLRVGDPAIAMVLPIGPRGGAYVEYLTLPARWVARAPVGPSTVEAATLPLNGLTARLALDQLELPPGSTLGVTGAVGGVGGYLVQLAKSDGLQVIADARPGDEALVRALGADQVVQRGTSFAHQVRDLVPAGLDAIADAAGVGLPALSAVRDGGQIAVIGSSHGHVPDGSSGLERGISARRVFVPDYGGRSDKLEELSRLAETGALSLRVADILPAERAPEAHRRLEAGGSRGRIVLTF